MRRGLSTLPVAAGTPKERKGRLDPGHVWWLQAQLRAWEVQLGHPAVPTPLQVLLQGTPNVGI